MEICKVTLLSLKLIHCSYYRPIKLKEDDRRELIHIYYAPLNFRDIMLATGKLASEVIIRNRLDQVIFFSKTIFAFTAVVTNHTFLGVCARFRIRGQV